MHLKAAGVEASKVCSTAEALATEATQRIVKANRAHFDTGANQHRINALEAELAGAQAEAAVLRARLHAFETSTSWSLTRPVRWAAQVLRSRRRVEAVASTPVPVPSAPAPLRYEEWIAAEAAWLPVPARPGPGRRPIKPVRLGLVLLADGHSLDLAGLLADCPGTCTILVLGKEAAWSAAAAQGRVLSMPVPLRFEPVDAVGLALGHLDVEMLCFLDARDRLAPGALSLMADAAAQQPQPDIVFADEDRLDAGGQRMQAFFKPGWDRELQRGRDLVGAFAFFRTALIQAATPSPGPAWLYDLANQAAAAARPERIHHVPAVLCHRSALPPGDAPGHAQAMRTAAAAQLRREGVAADVEPLPGRPGCHRVTYALPQPAPLVSVIVPTRDRADLLRACADGVLNGTGYPHLELLIVDNGTEEPDALALLDTLAADARVHVLRQPGPFNWSALNNAGAARAAGDVLVLLNNDIAVLQPDWLTVLVSHAVQPGVGAVGAKLLYPDGRVQHAGLTTDGTGVPRHLFRYEDGEAQGAFGLLAVAREVWGVTGACLAIRRAVFTAVGGLNEAFPVAYNDVDLCLRLTAQGYRIVWTPWSRVEHREMATRAPDHTGARREEVQEELARLMRDWGLLALHDPFLNPNLRLVGEQLCFREAPTAPTS